MRPVVFPAKRIAALLGGRTLVNIQGEVVGICTAIVASSQGIGFAIPRNMARTIVGKLREKGKVIRAWIGVSAQPVTAATQKFLALKGSLTPGLSSLIPRPPPYCPGPVSVPDKIEKAWGPHGPGLSRHKKGHRSSSSGARLKR